MRLMRLEDVEASSSDHIYRHSRVGASLITLTAMFVALLLLVHSVHTGWRPGYYFVAVIALLFAVMQRFITACFRQSNWLVRTNELGMFIQFRSYLNYHLPAEDLTVVFIPYQEIRSARLVSERRKFNTAQGRTATQTVRYVELDLGADPTPLANALQTELLEKAPQEKRWYGSSSTLYEDYPVRMPSSPFLQIQWSVAPGAHNLLDALRPYMPIAEPVLVTEDFSQLQSLSREEQENRLRELVQRGDTIVAMYTARRLYGCGLKEAQELVDKLRNSRAGASA
jgi:hypothetical protein